MAQTAVRTLEPNQVGTGAGVAETMAEPITPVHDWSRSKIGTCDLCATRGYLVPVDAEHHCSSCCTSNLLAAWKDYARSIACGVAERERAESLLTEHVNAQREALQTCERWFERHSPRAPLINGLGDAEHPMLTMIRGVLSNPTGKA